MYVMTRRPSKIGPFYHAIAADIARELDAHLLQDGFARWQLPDR